MPNSSSGAGLVHAPPFDPSSVLDPDGAPAAKGGGGDDLKSLAYYKEQHDRQTFRARFALLTIIFVMLAGNMLLTWQMRAEVMTNLDQTRLDQSALSEMVQTRVTALETQVVSLKAELAAARIEDAAVATAE